MHFEYLFDLILRITYLHNQYSLLFITLLLSGNCLILLGHKLPLWSKIFLLSFVSLCCFKALHSPFENRFTKKPQDKLRLSFVIYNKASVVHFEFIPTLSTSCSALHWPGHTVQLEKDLLFYLTSDIHLDQKKKKKNIQGKQPASEKLHVVVFFKSKLFPP